MSCPPYVSWLSFSFFTARDWDWHALGINQGESFIISESDSLRANYFTTG
jgi:hypothetical protein